MYLPQTLKITANSSNRRFIFVDMYGNKLSICRNVNKAILYMLLYIVVYCHIAILKFIITAVHYHKYYSSYSCPNDCPNGSFPQNCLKWYIASQCEIKKDAKELVKLKSVFSLKLV